MVYSLKFWSLEEITSLTPIIYHFLRPSPYSYHTTAPITSLTSAHTLTLPIPPIPSAPSILSSDKIQCSFAIRGEHLNLWTGLDLELFIRLGLILGSLYHAKTVHVQNRVGPTWPVLGTKPARTRILNYQIFCKSCILWKFSSMHIYKCVN